MLLAAVIPHEVAHLILAATTGHRPIPLALDEGFALRFEPPARHIRYERLLPRARRQWPPAKLLAASPQTVRDLPTFYAAARSFVDFLIATGGTQTFLEFCRDRAELVTMLHRHYNFANLAEAEAAWSEFLDRTIAGGLRAQP